MPRAIDPAVLRRRLRATLREARERASLTQRDVALEMDWSLSKLIRIESGVVSISTNDLRALLAHYNVTDPSQVHALVEMAREARRVSGWSVYSDLVSPEFLAYLAHESSANVIRGYEPLVVPGLLQTADYTRAALRGASVQPDEAIIQRRLDLRLDRQELLTTDAPPKLFFILDEAVIRRVVGGAAVMRDQLRYLLHTIDLGVAVVLIVPFAVGYYPLLRWPTMLLEFEDPVEPHLLFLERPEGDMLVREDEGKQGIVGSPANYLDAFFEVENLALDSNAATMIRKSIELLG